MVTIRNPIFFLLLTFLPSIGLVAQGKSSFMDWLQQQPDDVTLVLKSDFEAFKENRRKQVYQPAVFSVPGGSEEELEQEVEIRPRGKFRCIRCDMPPIKMKFSKDLLKESGFRKWNELKIVFPCQKGEKYEQWMYKEFLVYRLYNLLTDRSFRVKLVEYQLEDTMNPDYNKTTTGFVIEHEEEVAGRIGGKALDTMGVGGAGLERDDYTRYQVFQFMIGNTDWIPATSHNISLIRLDDGGLIPVPFDFDFSGLVNTDYAVPRTETRLESVEDRFFMGNEKTKDELEHAFAQFRAKKQAMIDLIDGFEPLDKRERKHMVRFLESFFDLIDSPRQVTAHFIGRPPFQEGVY